MQPPLFRAFARDLIAELIRLSRSPALVAALLLILPVAAFLCGLDVAHRYAGGDGAHLPWQFSLSEEESLGEWFEDLLMIAAAAAMLRLWWRSRAPIDGMVGLVLIWLAADNGLALHERLGAALAPLLAPLAGARAADLGEVVAFAGIGAAALTLIVLAALRSPREATIRASVPILFLAAAAAFAVGVDFIDQLDWRPGVSLALGFVEDGGELIMLSLACAFAIALGLPRPPRPAVAPARIERPAAA
jgi:hypothetical protein